MAGLETVALIASLAGTVVSAVGTIASGQAQQQAAEFEAQQLDIRAKQEFAASQAEAQEIERNKQLVLSRQQAVAAGSGFGADDPTVTQIAAETAGYGDEMKAAALASGQMRRQSAEYAAAAARASGQSAATGSYFAAGGTILGGFANAFRQKYGTGYQPASRPGYGAWGTVVAPSSYGSYSQLAFR